MRYGKHSGVIACHVESCRGTFGETCNPPYLLMFALMLGWLLCVGKRGWRSPQLCVP